MLTNEFCVKWKFWENKPHTHSPPSMCGRCVQQLVSEWAFTISLKNLGGDPWTHKWMMKFQSLMSKTILVGEYK